MGKLIVLALLATIAACQEQLVWQDEFDFLDDSKWQHFVTGWRGGNHEFQYYRNNRKNSYVRDGILYINPTLTADEYGEDFLYNGQINLWDEGCTDEMNIEGGCMITAGGDYIVNPVQSARLRSKYSFNFHYGRVEIRASGPVGDWLWPALWLLPQNDEYGGWPRSGEIDMFESKGNEQFVCNGQLEGMQKAGSTLHWGPDSGQNRFYLTTWPRTDEANPFGGGWHLFGLEWSDQGIKFTMDTLEIGAIYPPPGGFWEYGGFSGENPWAGGSKMAPFDKNFHFIINNAVGGNFFPDGCYNANGDKPWYGNYVPGAMKSFWEAHNTWYPTWRGEERALRVDYIRVWQNVGKEKEAEERAKNM